MLIKKINTIYGGLSGPAIKPIALANVHKIYKSVSIPIIGIGGIKSVDDIIEFILVGADLIQIGTLNYKDPEIGVRLVSDLENYLKDLPGGFNPGPLDLDKPLDNQIALLKLQADFSGADVQGGFGGQAWAWLPGKENILLFNTYGIGCSRLEYDRDSHSWHFSHREALFYLDPITNEVLKTWKNLEGGSSK